MPWYVLYTKSRNEKIVADRLRERSIEVYCPLIKKERKWSDRTKMVEEPLFRSYCFVKLEEKQRSQVFGVQGIVRYLFWQNKPAVVRDEEIEAIRHMLNDVDNDLITIKAFTPDEQVRIKSGCFTNYKGRTMHQQGNVLTLFIDSLQVVLKIDLAKTLVSA